MRRQLRGRRLRGRFCRQLWTSLDWTLAQVRHVLLEAGMHGVNGSQHSKGSRLKIALKVHEFTIFLSSRSVISPALEVNSLERQAGRERANTFPEKRAPQPVLEYDVQVDRDII